MAGRRKVVKGFGLERFPVEEPRKNAQQKSNQNLQILGVYGISVSFLRGDPEQNAPEKKFSNLKSGGISAERA